MKDKQKKILYIQYTNPAGFPPLENSSRLLADAGWQVKFMGTGALGSQTITFPPHKNIKVELAQFCYPGLKQKLHYAWYCFKTFKEIVFSDYACVYVSDIFSCPIGWIAAEWLGTQVIYHEHDSPEAPTSLFMKGLHWTRRQLSHKAKFCVFPQIERAQLFQRVFSRSNIQICHNMPLRARAYQNTRSSEGEFKLWYHGSLIPTLLPMTLVQALALLPKSVTLQFAGYETLSFPGFVDQLLAKAKELGVGSRVIYYGALSLDSLFEKTRSCDLGIALFDRNFREPMVGASNKPFDYMACGLPLLINDSAEWTHFFEKPGFGKSCNPESAESIAETIGQLLAHPEKLNEMTQLSLDKIKTEWNYETQFAPIQKWLEKEF